MTNDKHTHHVTGLTVGVDRIKKYITLFLASRSQGSEHGPADQFQCRLDKEQAIALVQQLSNALAEIQDHPNPQVH